MIEFPYKLAAGAALVLALFGVGYLAGYRHEHAAWAADVAKRNAAESAAILARNAENAKLAAQQSATNSSITKVKNEELTPVRERIVTKRVYVGSSICSGPSAATEAQGAPSSDGTNPSGRLVRPDIERDIVALKLKVEEDLATARACQAFIRENGME